MLPTEQFSGDATPGPPWTPAVWACGPDVLVAQAKAQLFGDQAEIAAGALGTNDRAISGNKPGVENESEQLIDGSTPGDSPSGSSNGARGDHWQEVMADLRCSEPLAAWAQGAKDGPPNPSA